MRFVGIDPSLTDTGYCELEQPATINEWLSLASDPIFPDFDRCEFIVNHILNEVIKLEPPIFVFMEGPSMGKVQTGKSFTRSELRGMIKVSLSWLEGVSFFEIPPTALKLWAAGHGKAEKDQMEVALFERIHVHESNDNKVDAGLLALMGSALVEEDAVFLKKYLVFRK